MITISIEPNLPDELEYDIHTLLQRMIGERLMDYSMGNPPSRPITVVAYHAPCNMHPDHKGDLFTDDSRVHQCTGYITLKESGGSYSSQGQRRTFKGQYVTYAMRNTPWYSTANAPYLGTLRTINVQIDEMNPVAKFPLS